MVYTMKDLVHDNLEIEGELIDYCSSNMVLVRNYNVVKILFFNLLENLSELYNVKFNYKVTLQDLIKNDDRLKKECKHYNTDIDSKDIKNNFIFLFFYTQRLYLYDRSIATVSKIALKTYVEETLYSLMTFGYTYSIEKDVIEDE